MTKAEADAWLAERPLVKQLLDSMAEGGALDKIWTMPGSTYGADCVGVDIIEIAQAAGYKTGRDNT